MNTFKNFKSVVYCVAQWANEVTKEDLQKQLAWIQKYVGLDKVYLETYRDNFASKEQILMIKKILEEAGVEVSGGITTVTPNLCDEDKNKQRLFNTFCYSNEKMRNRVKEVSEYTAQFFDEFIIDDFFFTQCMCDSCIKEKGNKSWKDYRLAKMMEVSENLIIKPAKKINPKIKIIIKFPNWRESFQETGYNPELQRTIFDGIYTGTETRHSAQTDQHLPRYLSYSLPRYFENALPNKNGGGWFDPFECDRIDTYLEQAYLTAFAKQKELMMFCWPAIYNNKRATPLKFMYEKLDDVLSECANPIGVPVYIPFNSQGEDHIEDFLGMIGIPLNPTPDFPEYDSSLVTDTKNSTVLVTQSSLYDSKIFEKIENFMKQGGKVIATGGFTIAALEQVRNQQNKEIHPNICDFTSVRYNSKQLVATQFQTPSQISWGKNYVESKMPIEFSLLEHRNNSTWSIMNAGFGDYHESILMYDTYSKGKFEILNLPELPSKIKDLPKEVLQVLRYELLGNGKIWLDCDYGVSLFSYDNDTFGLYSYTHDGCYPMEVEIHIKGKVSSLQIISESVNGLNTFSKDNPMSIKPLYEKTNDWTKETQTVFKVRILPGEFVFYRMTSC